MGRAAALGGFGERLGPLSLKSAVASPPRCAALALINEMSADRRISTPEVLALLSGLLDLPHDGFLTEAMLEHVRVSVRSAAEKPAQPQRR